MAGEQLVAVQCPAASQTLGEGAGPQQPQPQSALSAIAEAFEALSYPLAGDAGAGAVLRLDAFCRACSLVSPLFGCLGLAFKFAEMEYVTKVQCLSEASKEYESLNSILDYDIQNDTVKKQGSLSRNLRRVRLGLDLIKVLFEQFLSSDDASLKDAASTAYTEVCAPFHSWTVRKAVGAGMYTLPTRDQLILRLNETDDSVQKEMKRFVNASAPIIQYIDKLYTSRNITLDW